MIYKGKGKRTRFRRCRHSSWLHGVMMVDIYQGEVRKFNQITWRVEAKHLFIYSLYANIELNLEFI